jgi:hypothetical protein
MLVGGSTLTTRDVDDAGLAPPAHEPNKPQIPIPMLTDSAGREHQRTPIVWILAGGVENPRGEARMRSGKVKFKSELAMILSGDSAACAATARGTNKMIIGFVAP